MIRQPWMPACVYSATEAINLNSQGPKIEYRTSNIECRKTKSEVRNSMFDICLILPMRRIKAIITAYNAENKHVYL